MRYNKIPLVWAFVPTLNSPWQKADETCIQGIVNEGVGLVSYNPHFKGAITLLRMREEEQFSTSHGTEMFDFVMQVLVCRRLTLHAGAAAPRQLWSFLPPTVSSA